MSKKCFVCGNRIGFFSSSALTKDSKYICADDINRYFGTKDSSISFDLALKIRKLTSSQILNEMNEFKNVEEKKQQEQEELRKNQIEWWQTEDLSVHAKKIDSLKLAKNEYCYYKSSEPINWKEDRVSTRRINYGGLTTTIHIAKGFNYRLGSINTAIKKSTHIVTVLTGTLFLTNKRIIITSDNQIKVYRFERLLKMEPYLDGVTLYSSAGKRVILDGFTDATHFNIYLDRLTF